MPQTFQYPIVSREATNFTEALAQNVASAMNNLPGFPAGGLNRWLIRAIQVIALQNFAPELDFFSKAAGFSTTDPASDFFLSRWAFTAGMGTQLNATGLWRYYVDGLAIPYVDLDTMGKNLASLTVAPTLHVVMQNNSITGKSAAAAGYVQLTVWVEPMQAF